MEIVSVLFFGRLVDLKGIVSGRSCEVVLEKVWNVYIYMIKCNDINIVINDIVIFGT